MSLRLLIEKAIERRAEALSTWHAEDTDCYRLFSGQAEEFPGLDIDRLGPILLIQTWRYPLDPGELELITETCSRALNTPLSPCWNHHSRPIDFPRWHRPLVPRPCTGRELGLRYEVEPRHGEPWPLLSTEMRTTRGWLSQHSRGRSVLSLFAGSCTLGTAAAANGASEVWNVDRSSESLSWGKRNATLNRIGRAKIRWVEGECMPALRQLAGLSVRLRDDKEIDFPKLSPRKFDLVLLDPPHGSSGPFGTIDLVERYEEFFKPALQCVKTGGQLLAFHPVAEINREDWLRYLIHWAEQIGLEIDFRVLHAEEDFPGTDTEPALKMVLVEPR